MRGRPAWSTVSHVVGRRGAIELLRRHPHASDAALAGLLAVVVLGDVVDSAGYLTGSRWVYVPAGLAMTLPLALRRRTPLLVVAVVMGALVAQTLLLTGSTPSPDTELIPWLLAVYSVSAHGSGRAPILGGAISLAAGVVWLGPDDFLLPFVIFGGAWIAGRLVRNRRLHAGVLEERARVLELERDVNARVAAAEERVRLARELHDVVGHSVSVIVVQAGAERLALGDGAPSTREALLAIEQTGRAALTEMSRLLGLLRRDDEGLALEPRPSLGDVAALAAHIRAAGVPVQVRIEGEPVVLPAGVDVSAYRIVQEALTNVVRHAGPAEASVVVRYELGSVEIEVSDDGRGAEAGNAPGYGLAGMRERVALHGGTLEASDGAGGGFTVRARLPLAGSVR
jgi:signal transduction histidine kinase